MKLPYLGALALLAALQFSAPAGAAVYKCTNAAGAVVYQGTPCQKGSSGDAVNIVIPGAGPGQGFASATPEEREWAERVKPGIVNACRAGGARGPVAMPLTRSQVQDMCLCTADRYFNAYPIAKLRDLESRGDENASAELMRPLLAECEKRVLTKAAEEAGQ